MVKSHHVYLFWAVLGHFKPLCADCGRCQSRELLGERESTVFSCCACCTGSRCWCTEATGGLSGGAAQLDQPAKTRQKLDPKKLVNTCNSLTNFEYESMAGNGNQVNLLTLALKFRKKNREITSSKLNFGGKTTVHCRPRALKRLPTSQRPCWSFLVLKTSSIFSCRLRGLLQPRELQNSVKTEWRMFY